MCLIMVSKEEMPYIKYQEPRIKEFPVAFSGSPKVNGLPHKNAKMIPGSNNILQTLKTRFGKTSLSGSNIDIDYSYNNTNNISNLNNIREHRNNCFGKTCHVMDRPYGPSDNQYILQGYQPSCAVPYRSDLPIKSSNKNNFGMTTPGTKNWQLERRHWPCPDVLVNDSNCALDLNASNKKLNFSNTYSNDYLNRLSYNDNNKINNFGKKIINEFFQKKYLNKFITAPVNSNYPFLTYSAGGDTVSRVTGKNYLPEQNSIQNQVKNAYISGDLKQYVNKHPCSQTLLYNGLNSSNNTNKFGKDKNKYGKTNSSGLGTLSPGPPKFPMKKK